MNLQYIRATYLLVGIFSLVTYELQSAQDSATLARTLLADLACYGNISATETTNDPGWSLNNTLIEIRNLAPFDIKIDVKSTGCPKRKYPFHTLGSNGIVPGAMSRSSYTTRFIKTNRVVRCLRISVADTPRNYTLFGIKGNAVPRTTNPITGEKQTVWPGFLHPVIYHVHHAGENSTIVPQGIRIYVGWAAINTTTNRPVDLDAHTTLNFTDFSSSILSKPDIVKGFTLQAIGDDKFWASATEMDTDLGMTQGDFKDTWQDDLTLVDSVAQMPVSFEDLLSFSMF